MGGVVLCLDGGGGGGGGGGGAPSAIASASGGACVAIAIGGGAAVMTGVGLSNHVMSVCVAALRAVMLLRTGGTGALA